MNKKKRERNRMRRWLKDMHGVEMGDGCSGLELCDAVETQLGVDLCHLNVGMRMAVLQRKIEGPSKKIKNPRKIKKKVDFNEFAKTTDFLQTYMWRQLRYRAIKAAGGECLSCGATAGNSVKLHVDHIKPRKTHPHLALEMDNLQVLCNACNHGKGNWDTTDWR